VHCPNDAEIHERFAGPIALLRSVMTEVEVAVLSAAEIAFRCHGLEVARARMSAGGFSAESGMLRSVPELLFGQGPVMRALNDGNLEDFEQLIRSVGEVRHADGPKESRWWRLHPERWLESLADSQKTR
jgi:hypothetical protein